LFSSFPKAGTSLKHVLEFCYGLIRAEKYRDPQVRFRVHCLISSQHICIKYILLLTTLRILNLTAKKSLEILYKGKHRFVNVGTDTPTAIIEARKIKLVESGMAQTIATSFFYEGSFLFTPDHKGRMITLLRHPVERAHSLFHYLCKENEKNLLLFFEHLAISHANSFILSILLLETAQGKLP
jgi:hypothetical protein